MMAAGGAGAETIAEPAGTIVGDGVVVVVVVVEVVDGSGSVGGR